MISSRRETAGRSTARCARYLLWVVLATAGLTPTTLARGEWYDFYSDALASLEAGEAQRAIELFESALARKDRSGYFRTYGNNYVRYSPYFYLGVAQHDAGDCESALVSFGRSVEAQETRPTPELDRRLDALRSRCEESRSADLPERSPPAVTNVEPEPAPVVEAVAPIDSGTLEQGLAAYLAGDFRAATLVFGGLVRDAPRSAQLRLLLGSALHGVWVIEGSADEQTLEESRRELAEAAGLDSALVPDPALYPPPVVALFRSLR